MEGGFNLAKEERQDCSNERSAGRVIPWRKRSRTLKPILARERWFATLDEHQGNRSREERRPRAFFFPSMLPARPKILFRFCFNPSYLSSIFLFKLHRTIIMFLVSFFFFLEFNISNCEFFFFLYEVNSSSSKLTKLLWTRIVQRRFEICPSRNSRRKMILKRRS